MVKQGEHKHEPLSRSSRARKTRKNRKNSKNRNWPSRMDRFRLAHKLAQKRDCDYTVYTVLDEVVNCTDGKTSLTFNDCWDVKSINGISITGNIVKIIIHRKMTITPDIKRILRYIEVINGKGRHNVKLEGDMSGLFAHLYWNFKCDMSRWDTSEVTSMAYMFYYARHFNLDISRWNTGMVTTMKSMFEGCTTFNQYIGAWDFSSVTDTSHMFSGCKLFNQYIGAWDFSSVTDASHMFSYCEKYNQDMQNLDTSKITDVRNMFKYATEFNQNLNAWDLRNVVAIHKMLTGADSYSYNVLNLNLSSRLLDRCNYLAMAHHNRECMSRQQALLFCVTRGNMQNASETSDQVVEDACDVFELLVHCAIPNDAIYLILSFMRNTTTSFTPM